MNKISSKELLVFSFFLTCFLFPGFGDTIIIQKAGNTSVLSAIIGCIIGFVPLLMILYISKQMTNKNIFQLNKEKFKWFGTILNILLTISIVYIMMMASWSIINFTISQFLTRTSYYLVLSVTSIVIILAVTKNIEVIGRTSLILMGIFIITTIGSWIFLIPDIELHNLQPIFDVDKTQFIKSWLIFPTFSVFPLISLLFIKKNDVVENKKSNKNIVIGYVFGSLLAIIFLFFILSVFGIDMAKLFVYPEYTLFKKIQAFNFIERIENILAIIIFIASFISFSVMNLFVKESVRNLFNIKKEKVINIIMIAIIIIVPFVTIYLFQNHIVIDLYTKYPTISLFIFIPLIINFFLLVISKKRS